MIKRLLNTPYAFWAILALPSFAMINAALSGADLEELLHPTGEFAARLMILAMLLTPLQLLLPKKNFVTMVFNFRNNTCAVSVISKYGNEQPFRGFQAGVIEHVVKR